MKKFFTGVVTALLLVAVMGTTVFAAGSPSSTPALRQELSDKITAPSNVRKTSASESEYSEAWHEADRDGGTVMAMSNLSVTSGTSQNIKLTLTVRGEVRNVYILHKKGTSWEIVKPDSVSYSNGNTVITVTLSSLSPVAVVSYPTGTTPANVVNPSGSSTTNTTSTNSNNTTGDTQNNSQTNNNNQNNNQNNTQNNPVNVNQNVTVNYPDSDNGDYDDGYADGYEDGKASASNRPSSGSSTNKGSSGSSVSKKTDVKSPKTGETLPVVPVIGLLATVGIGLAGRKFR